jgi:CRISPR-associated exonuclease Cas4
VRVCGEVLGGAKGVAVMVKRLAVVEGRDARGRGERESEAGSPEGVCGSSRSDARGVGEGESEPRRPSVSKSAPMRDAKGVGEGESESDGSTEGPDLAVSDVRQWTFCPRVLWHRRLTPHRVHETPKMALGRDAQAALEGLERRRSAKRYGLDAATRRFNVPLASRSLRVRGVCDAVLEVPVAKGQPRRLYPVEVKRTEGGASSHHVVQLAGYAVLLEEEEGLAEGCVARGFLVLLPSGRLVPVDVGPGPREAFKRALADIRSMLVHERFPDPTKHRGFCPQCEYVRFCGDVL